MLLVFQFEISGKEVKDVHPANIVAIFVEFSIFHLEILGKYFSDEHPANKPFKLYELFKSSVIYSSFVYNFGFGLS